MRGLSRWIGMLVDGIIGDWIICVGCSIRGFYDYLDFALGLSIVAISIGGLSDVFQRLSD